MIHNSMTIVFRHWLPALLTLFCFASAGLAQQYQPPRCEIVPLADHEVSLRIDGHEKLRWHYGDQYPRPFFYPFNGPSGETLTRMGHPGAQNHDHHRSVWFAHHKVDGINFWGDGTGTRIRQTHWYRYRDGDDEAVMATHLVWIDQEGVERMQQDVVVALLPIEGEQHAGEHAIEFQLTFRPGEGRQKVTLEQTNFGVLAVRVAASISAYFGGGRLTNDAGLQGEPKLHEQRSRWMDYSGPIAVPGSQGRTIVEEGITYFDHPNNPGYPTHWHVRQDGWMGAAPGMKTAIDVSDESPLVLRYLLYAHSGPAELERAEQVQEAFMKRPGFRVRAPGKDEPHRQYEVERVRE
ncbi:hypothetical protein Mal15_12820 [Stieleria maiorica]|uniref:Methane oxygenase PmoA n=1 Tax=Stieleria maiorica TaxID=2795974 RepID=A0A5B9M984_9BACT|nr:PmoA family protein [Stieleria maiorica]QEF97243.1 hypothetical protein Mal15_12820 [Stieleria maiorica]